MSDDSMMNVFSLALPTDKFHITFDSAVENAFDIHAPCSVVEFERGPENMLFQAWSTQPLEAH